MRVLVTGSRDWTDEDTIGWALDFAHKDAGHPEDFTVVHGDARGADSIAHRWAVRSGFNVEPHPANWDKFGRRAGHVRNYEMVKAGADLCLAFPLGDSPGTRGCIKAAVRAGIPVKIVERH